MTVFTWKQSDKYSRNLCGNRLTPNTAPNDTQGVGCQVCVIPYTREPTIVKIVTDLEVPVAVGTYIDYQVTVTNNTGEDLTDVLIADPLDPLGEINIGNLADTDNYVHTYTYLVTADDITAGSVTNTSTVTAAGNRKNWDTEVTSLT